MSAERSSFPAFGSAAADRDRRLRHGQPPLRREGARARRRAGAHHERPRRAAAADGLLLPASAPSPRRCEAIRERGLDTLLRERARRERRSSAPASACSCSSSTPRSTVAPRASGCSRARLRAARERALKLPHIGWSAVSWRDECAAPLSAGLPESRATSTTCTASSSVPPTRPSCSRPPSTARRFPASSAGATSSARSRTPRSPRRTACACSRTSPRSARARPRARRSPRRLRDPLSRDRHPRRQRRAPAQGRFRGEQGLRRGPARCRAGVGGGGRASSSTWSTSTARGRARPANLEHVAASLASSALACSSVAACARPRRSREALDAGVARVILGTAAFTDPELLERRSRRTDPSA